MRLKLIFFVCFSIYSVLCDDEATEQSKPQYVRKVPEGPLHFIETFEANIIGSTWMKSKAKKEDVEESLAKYDGDWAIESSLDTVLEGDKGLVLKSKAKHHAIAAKLAKPFKFNENKPLVVQYEVKFQNALECGGAYVKLIEDKSGFNLEDFFDKTSFSIMFGPDKCGSETKFHFIVRFKNPINGKVEEHHAKKSELLDTVFSDGKTHLFTLILRPDGTFKMLIDRVEVNSGSLLTDMSPSINPPKEIVDPNDRKPDNWDDKEKIADPDAVKPEDWDESEPKTIADPNASMPSGWLEDEPETVPDSEAVMPEDWDESTDGEWEAPQIDNPKCKSAPGCGKWSPPNINNPKYKGKWKPPMIDNPNYQGVWEARKIANPDFFEDSEPFKSLLPFSSVGLELWSMTENIYFDNFLVTDDESVAEIFAQENWVLKNKLEMANVPSSDSVFEGLARRANANPWLWAVYILVVLIPIVLIVVFCCGKDSNKKKLDSKKTDAVTPDDEPVDQPMDEPAADEPEQQETEETEEVGEDVGKDDLESVENNENKEATESSNKSPGRRRVRKD
ncbi:Calnexin [Brachionus plicatilis]|uniref:Calnexin n=1 Tax=Brachionus plicatilis TaxID=10195 RepID=A0A3M7QWF8_BRAPC|nr:Calnexin [Brachionus plicatilis]